MLGADTAVEESTIKLVTTLEARIIPPGQTNNDEMVAPPCYVAPQVILACGDCTSDLWSAGVVMYSILCGYPPFDDETDEGILAKVRLGNYSFVHAGWAHISDSAKDLVRKLLKLNPRDRLSAAEALQHEWLVVTDFPSRNPRSSSTAEADTRHSEVARPYRMHPQLE